MIKITKTDYQKIARDRYKVSLKKKRKKCHNMVMSNIKIGQTGGISKICITK